MSYPGQFPGQVPYPGQAPYPGQVPYPGQPPYPGSYPGQVPAQAPHPPHLFSVHTPDNYNYQCAPFAVAPGDVVYFNVAAHNDAHVALSADGPAAQTAYEIALGGWGNSKSVLRRARQGQEVAAHQGAVLGGVNEYRGFYVTVTPSGQVVVGQQVAPGQYNVILQYTDPQPHQVRYIGVSTGWGSTGNFHLVKQAAQPYM